MASVESQVHTRRGRGDGHGRVGVVSFLLGQTWAVTGQKQGARPGFWPWRLAGGGAVSDHVGWQW